MAIVPIGPNVTSQPLNDNFADYVAHKAETVTGWFNVVTGYSADSTGVTDSSAEIQASINACALAGGGVVYFPPGTYLINAALNLESDVNLLGYGATLLMDFTGDRGLLGLGTISSEVTVTVNISAGDVTINVASTSSPVAFALGDVVRITDIHPNTTYYPASFGIVKSLTSTTITLQSAIPVKYLTSNTTTVSKMTPVENVTVEGLTILASDTSDIRYMLGFQYAKDIRVCKTVIRNHRSLTNPGLLISYWNNNVYNLTIENNTKYGVADITLDSGDSIHTFQCQNTKIVSNTVMFGVVGISSWMGNGTLIDGNHVEGIRTNGSRGIKVVGSYYVRIVDNMVKSFDSGLKTGDGAYYIIENNHIVACGIDPSGSSAINCSNEYGTLAPGEYIGTVVKGNQIYGINGNGVYLDLHSRYCIIEGNHVSNVTGRGIISDAPYSQVLGNQVLEMGDIGVQFNPIEAIVKGNHVYATSGTVKSFGLTNTNYAGCIFSDNVAENNALDTTYDVTAVGFFGNNYIGGIITKYIDRVNRGKATVVITADTFGQLTVTFADPYPTGMIPIVVATCDQGSYYAVVSTVSNTGFTVLALHRDGTSGTINVGVGWIAVKPQ